MSSYATLSLGSFELWVTRNEVDPGLMWIFRPLDKRIERIDKRDRRRLAQYIVEEYIDEYDERNPFSIVEYTCTTAIARDRMDLKGFTYEVAEAIFKKELEADAQRYEGYLEWERTPYVSNLWEERLALLRHITLGRWQDALTRIREEHLTIETLDGLPDTDGQLPILRYMLEDQSGFYGFPGDDYRHGIRVALETAGPLESLTYNLTNLVVGGWVAETDDLVAVAERSMDEDFLLLQRVIVLTEGDTDREVLERSLRLLYPHLAEYFHFFHVTGKKLGGGVGELANLVRAFAAANVCYRILALFDNDTAARAALSNLDPDNLPSNIVVRHYPNIALAEDYPTLGPSGKARMDVNGLAGSLELYLGQDVLKDDEGVFPPVQWKGYEPKLRAYQGEILDKPKVLDRFIAKLARCEACPDQVDHYDWEGLRAIIHSMRMAFHHAAAQAILSESIYG